MIAQFCEYTKNYEFMLQSCEFYFMWIFKFHLKE